MRDRLFKWIADLVWDRPWTVLVAAAVLSAVCLAYAGLRLELNANTDDLIAADRPFMVEYRRFLREFGDLEYIWVVVENGGDAGRTRAVVDELARRLRADAGMSSVYGAITPEEQLRIATRARASRTDPRPAMSDQELRDLVSASDAFPAILTGDAGLVLGEANRMLAELVRRGRELDERQQERAGASALFLLNAVAAAREGSPARRRLAPLMLSGLGPEYFTSESGRFYFITVIPEKDYSTLSVVEEPLRRIRAVIDAVKRENPGVNIGLTGKPVLQADEMATSDRDMTRASIIAFVLVAALFMWTFGGIWKPVLAVIAFACGSAWTYGAATLLVGQLNLLSIVFMLVLIGVGLDYGIHILIRYKENRRTQEVRPAIAGAIQTAVRGNLTGALTSAAVFLAALFTGFQGLRELGLIAGVGLILCFVALAVVLPALVVIADRRRTGTLAPDAAAAPQAPPGGVLGLAVRNPGRALVIVGLATAAFSYAPTRLHFERNLLELQAQGLESVEWEHRIMADSTSASWFGASIADDPQQVLQTIALARHQPSIGTVRSVFDLVHEPVPGRDELRAQLRLPPQAAGPASAPATQPVRAEDLSRAVASLNVMALGAASQAPEAAAELRQAAADLARLAERLRQGGPPADAARADVARTVRELGDSMRLLLAGDDLPLRDALPDALRQQYVAPSGRYLVMLHPKEDVWDAAAMARYVRDLREVDPRVTGAPVSHFESLNDMVRAFVQMSVYSLVAITAIVLLDYRSAHGVLLSIVPTAFGLVWLVELMGCFGISFNMANFFSVPILIGLSVDGNVHMLHRYYEGGGRLLRFGATRRAVIVTALTTTIGFGALLIAHHRGVRSLGAVMAIGSLTCLAATVTVLPALLAWLERGKRAGGAAQSE
jgi:hopanoid biosynthesis associated RND transporter like protein HpnN